MTRYRLVACSDGPLSEGDIHTAVRASDELWSEAGKAAAIALEAALKGAGDDKDGERYRWLRKQPSAAMFEEGWQIRQHYRERGRERAGHPTPGLDMIIWSGDSLDSAIDSAISSAKGEV